MVDFPTRSFETTLSIKAYVTRLERVNKLQVPLSFKAFDRSVDLKLRRNDKIVAPQFRVWKHNDEDVVEELPQLSNPVSCHYLHRDDFSSAAISLCKGNGVVSITKIRGSSESRDNR